MNVGTKEIIPRDEEGNLDSNLRHLTWHVCLGKEGRLSQLRNLRHLRSLTLVCPWRRLDLADMRAIGLGFPRLESLEFQSTGRARLQSIYVRFLASQLFQERERDRALVGRNGCKITRRLLLNRAFPITCAAVDARYMRSLLLTKASLREISVSRGSIRLGESVEKANYRNQRPDEGMAKSWMYRTYLRFPDQRRADMRDTNDFLYHAMY